MIKIVKNSDNLLDKDITDISRRVKVLLVNSREEILLGYSHHEYQFPGGHVEDGEELIDALVREIKEETGIMYTDKSIKPFAYMIGYYKDWPQKDRNKKVEIYYYEIKTDTKLNMDNMNLTDKEIEGNFELRYIKLKNVINEIDKNAKEYGNEYGIANEMKEILKEYMTKVFL